MKTLLIKAHPAKYGFTHEIADVYKDAVEQAGGTVEIIDLYNDERYQQPFLNFQDVKGVWSGQEVRERIQEKISWANELVFIYPVWWSGMPAIMKNFLDNNLTKGFAYTSQHGRLVGLLKDKSVRVFMTGDAPWLVYVYTKFCMRLLFTKNILAFCGMQLESFDIFSNMAKCKERCRRDKMLDTVRSRIF